MKEKRAIDVYSGQGNIEWSAVAMRGDVTLAIIKATEGATVTDVNLARNAHKAAAAGLPVSYYHFGRPDLGEPLPLADARQEAAYFLTTIAGLPMPAELTFASGRTAAVWLDLEKPIARWAEIDGLRWVREFLNVVEKQYPVGLYTSRAWLEAEVTPDPDSMTNLLVRPDGTKRALWIAKYGINDGNVPDRTVYNPDTKVPTEWGTWDIWQYSSKGRVAGVPTPCDVNLARYHASMAQMERAPNP